MGKEDRATGIDVPYFPHDVHDFRTIIVFLIVHVIQITFIVQPGQDAAASRPGCTDRLGAVDQSNSHERYHY